MTRPKRRPEALGHLVGDYLAKRGLAKRLDLATAVERWGEVVGPRVAANAQAEAVSADGVLWVKVRSSPWALELNLLAPKLLARLNAERTGKIVAIRCSVGPIEAPKPTPKPTPE
jgi:predicted nucleic acid-binding Zn ribbon protein